MKKLILLLALFVSVSAAVAASYEKEYQKLASEFDVATEVRTLTDVSTQEYWDAFLNKNELFLKHLSDMDKKKGAENKTMQILMESPKFYPQYSTLVDRSLQDFCDSLLAQLGVPADGPNCAIYAIDSDAPAPFTVLTEDGFAVCLPTALLNGPGLTDDMLLGMVANQYAHGALKHAERGVYAQVKYERKTSILAGVAYGLFIVTAAWGEANNQNNNSLAADTYYIQKEGDRIAARKELKDALYAYDYSAKQVYEADIAAFRYMQFLDKADAYIEALKYIGANGDITPARSDANPTISSRINFLNYLREHPELGNTINHKLKKKRMKSLIVY